MFGIKKDDDNLKFQKESLNKQVDASREASYLDSTKDDHVALEMQQERTDLLKWQQDLDDELQGLIHTLKSEMLDPESMAWVAKKRFVWKDGKPLEVIVPPLCNDQFIHDVVIPQCKPFLSRNQINTNLTERTILMTLRFTFDDIADAMVDNNAKYGIEFTDFDLIMRLLKNVCRPGIYRSINGWNKKTDSTIFKSVETRSDMQNAEKKKLLGMFAR